MTTRSISASSLDPGDAFKAPDGTWQQVRSIRRTGGGVIVRTAAGLSYDLPLTEKVEVR